MEGDKQVFGKLKVKIPKWELDLSLEVINSILFHYP